MVLQLWFNTVSYVPGQCGSCQVPSGHALFEVLNLGPFVLSAGEVRRSSRGGIGRRHKTNAERRRSGPRHGYQQLVTAPDHEPNQGRQNRSAVAHPGGRTAEGAAAFQRLEEPASKQINRERTVCFGQ